MIDSIRAAVRNLKRKWRRSVLTFIGIAVGVASVVVISTIGEYGKTTVTTELESLGLGGIMVSANSQTGYTSMEEKELEVIKKNNHVEHAMPVMMLYSTLNIRKETKDTLILGVDETADQIISLEVVHGRGFHAADISSNAKVCLIDQNLAKSAYSRENIVGKEIYLSVNGSYDAYTVIGIIKTGSGLLQSALGSYIPTFVYVPYSTLQQSVGETTFQQIAVRVDNENDVDDISASIVKSLERETGNPGMYTAENLAKQKDGLTHLLDTITLALTAIGAISLFVASLSIMTMMLVSVNERTREIGIKKSIGASKNNILMEFLTEALLISMIGSLIGAGIGILVTYLASLSLGVTVTFQLDMILYTILLSIGVGVIFGVNPALKAANMQPVDALRTE